jgi:hypothetical protein
VNGLLLASSAGGAVGAVLLALRLATTMEWLPGRRGLFSAILGLVTRHHAGPGECSLMTGAGWRAMRLVAWLMPRAMGRRWLAEAESFLAEAPPLLGHGAIRSYLVSAPLVIVVSWAGALVRRARLPRVARTRGDA